MTRPAPIRARPADWAIGAMRAYIRRSAGAQFHGWHVHAEDLAAVRDTRLPLLFVPNHSSWWDGFLAFELAGWLNHRFYVMMQADQLRQARFFARCGAFSLERGAPRAAYDDLRYAATLLAPGHGLWMFPQGRRCPAGAAIAPEAGLTRLLAWAPPTRVVPVAFRYAFLSEEHPEAFAWLGESWVSQPGDRPSATLARVRDGMEAARGALDAALATTERAGFEPLLAGAPSSNKRLTAMLARWGLAAPEAVRNG